MNTMERKNLIEIVKFKMAYYSRLFERPHRNTTFLKNKKNAIGRSYVINLDRQQKRWNQMTKELKRINLHNQETLHALTRRFSAVDARYLPSKIDEGILNTTYTLSDQLTVEPNEKITDAIDTESIVIEMTDQEIAIALSHIEIWQLIAASDINYTLILEDDVYFKKDFSKILNKLWKEIQVDLNGEFDILFLSYEHVKDAKVNPEINPKNKKYHKPLNGIWQASGYILSKKGAQKLLNLLPVYGPIDLWLNLVFNELNVYVVNKPIIIQRIDTPSTNSYSIMPIFSKLGLYTGDSQSRYEHKDLKSPIFVFGSPQSHFTSIAHALMLLGYTCLYNLDELPEAEEKNFWNKNRKNLFNAYVNVKSLNNIDTKSIKEFYPDALFINLTNEMESNNKTMENVLHLSNDATDKWGILCDFLELEYPSVPFPEFNDNQILQVSKNQSIVNSKVQRLKFDDLPWILESNENIFTEDIDSSNNKMISWTPNKRNDLNNWKFRSDTFPSNLALFKPENVLIHNNTLELVFSNETSSVRTFTSGALVSKEKFLYGRFKVELRSPNIDGLITGIFLHRNSPHQEIDIEFLGRDTTKMLINVYYNPGISGTKFEYGYRGTPVMIDLGFDASEEFHTYEIEWNKNSIKWFVDGMLIYERGIWSPTPIPNLPMEFNINLWHSRSKELSGTLNKSYLPAKTIIKKIELRY